MSGEDREYTSSRAGFLANEFAELGMLAVDVPAPPTGVSKADLTAIENVMVAISEDETLHDAVILPEHYARFAIEPIRFIVENNLNFMQGNIVKYTLRWDAKDGPQDIRKVIRYGVMLYLFIRKDPDWWKPAPKGKTDLILEGKI